MGALDRAAPGLVTSPISRRVALAGVPDTVPEGLASRFRFPSADLLSAAAAMFSRPEVHAERPGGTGVVLAEGPWPFVDIAAGLVRVRWTDVARQGRAAERRQDADRLAVDVDLARDRVPMVWAPEPPPQRGGVRGEIRGWSRDSIARMLAKISTLDLAPLVMDARPPAMVTLTLPAEWLLFAHSAAHAARLLDTWRKAYRRRWGVPAAIWKREFQRRGAPHWHLWLVPPTDDLAAFRSWLSSSWNDVVFGSRVAAGPLRDGEQGKHLRAGTGLDFAEGLRARDPRRLALYFLKESLGGEGKAYQNDPPAEWAGQSVGRFWGVWNIPEAVETVPLAPDDAVRVWRTLRRLRERSAGARPVLVLRGVTAAGEPKYRRVRRRLRVAQRAGWVAVNDGAAIGAALARMLEGSVTA